MAKQTQTTAADLEKQLADLEKQRDELRERLQALDAAQAGMDISNPREAVRQLKEQSGEGEAIKRVLPGVERAIDQTHAQLAALKAAEIEARVQGLRAPELKAAAEIAKAVQTLDAKLAEYEKIAAQIAHSQAHPRPYIQRSLHAAVNESMNYWRKFRPEVMGLPPNPTPAQRQRAEDRKHAEETIKEADGQILFFEEANRRGDDFRRPREMIETWKQIKGRAQAVLAEAK